MSSNSILFSTQNARIIKTCTCFLFLIRYFADSEEYMSRCKPLTANIAKPPFPDFCGSLQRIIIDLGVATLLLDVLWATSLFRLWVEEEGAVVGRHLGIDMKWADWMVVALSAMVDHRAASQALASRTKAALSRRWEPLCEDWCVLWNASTAYEK